MSKYQFGVVDDADWQESPPYPGVLGLAPQVRQPYLQDGFETFITALSSTTVGLPVENKFALSFGSESTKKSGSFWIGGDDPSVTDLHMFELPSTLEKNGVWGFDSVTLTYGSGEFGAGFHRRTRSFAPVSPIDKPPTKTEEQSTQFNNIM